MRKTTKRSAAVLSGSLLAVAGGTAAFAYASGWFKGDGNVYAATSSIQTVHAEVNLGNTVATRLWPGHTVSITAANVNNPNDYPVLISNVAVNSVSSTKSGCGKDEAALVFGAVPAGTTIPAGTNQLNVPLGSITMGQHADPACAGAILTVTADLTGEIAS